MTAATFWTIVITSVTTSVLTGLSAIGVWWAQRVKEARDAKRAARDAAYVDLIRCILDFSMRVRALADTMHFRSGLKEDAAVALGHRKPLDPAEFFPRFLEEFRPLNAAWSAVHVHGSQAGIDLSDTVLEASTDLMEAATAVNDERPRIARAVFGERWTERKSATFDEAIRRLMRHRADLIHLARRESGREAVIMAIDEAAAP